MLPDWTDDEIGALREEIAALRKAIEEKGRAQALGNVFAPLITIEGNPEGVIDASKEAIRPFAGPSLFSSTGHHQVS
jgi:hypothetical protein